MYEMMTGTQCAFIIDSVFTPEGSLACKYDLSFLCHSLFTHFYILDGQSGFSQQHNRGW